MGGVGEIRLQIGEETMRELLQLEDWDKRAILDALIADTIDGGEEPEQLKEPEEQGSL